MAAIVILIIIAAAGWGAYAAYPMSKTFTTTAGAQTVTVSGGSGSGTATVTQTVTTSAPSSANASQVYLPPTTSSESFTIGGFTGTSQFADWFFVQQQGIAKEYIPNAKFTSLSGAQLGQALASGTAQMGFGDPTSLLGPISKGASIVLVANLIGQGVNWMFLTATNSKIHSVQDLKGAVLSVSTPGSTGAYVQGYILNEFGMKAGQDYTITPTGSLPGQLAAVESGSAAATIAPIQTAYPFVSNGTLRSFYNFTLPYPALALFSTSSFIQQHPDAVRATIEAFLKADSIWDSNSTAAIGLLETQYHLNPAAAQFGYYTTYFSTDGYISLSLTQGAANVLYQQGGLSQNISASSFVSREFVPITT